ncbi:hypothetical protein ABZ832_06775 [Streptantibioticus parmotrematis]|uniref:hypothetical protein n=1 Tax=Streptantibioticus parmotrematis TaxID=2873249 RepID=UPI0033F94D6E
MKKIAFSMALATFVALSPVCAAAGDELPAGSIQELTGQGEGACPSMSLCLYQDHDLNAAKPARIWVFPVAEGRQDVSLKGNDAADRPSSGYLNAPKLGWAGYLFPDYTCGFEGNRGAEAIQFHGGRRLNSLDGVRGRAKRYGYFNYRGKWSTEKKWGVTEQTLNLNDRAGCVSTGSWNSTSDLRPPIDGTM